MTMPYKFYPRNYSFGLYLGSIDVQGYDIQLFLNDKTSQALKGNLAI